MAKNFMLATVAPLAALKDATPGPEQTIFDRLLHDLCMPKDDRYQRLSEMLGDGWSITAMIEHPMVKNAILVSLVRSGW